MNEMGGYSLPMQIMASWAEGYEKGGQNIPGLPENRKATPDEVTNYYGPRFAGALNASLKPFKNAVPGENLLSLIGQFGEGGATAAATGAVQNVIGRVTVPGAARFLENLSDPVARDVQRKGVAALWEPTAASWPGLSQFVPPKIDPTTGEVMGKARSGLGTLVGAQQDVASPITLEVDRLKKKGYDITAPKTYPESVSISGAEVKLSPDEQRQVAEITGKTLGNFAERLSQPDYQNSSENRKAQLMQSYLNAAERARASAVRQVLGQPELRRRVLAGQRTVGRLNVQATTPEVPFLSSSSYSADEQRQLAGVGG
jgi:hypothetical protein